jgi:hypothetical protein
MTCDDAINKAIAEVEIARKQFNNADKDFIDVAIMKLNSAEEYLNLLIKMKKQNNK